MKDRIRSDQIKSKNSHSPIQWKIGPRFRNTCIVYADPSERTFRRIELSAEHHLHRSTSDAPIHHTFPHLCQPWAYFKLASILPIRELTSRPQNLSCCTRSGPHHIVEIDRISLLTPDAYLTSLYQFQFLGGQSGSGIVRVY